MLRRSELTTACITDHALAVAKVADFHVPYIDDGLRQNATDVLKKLKDSSQIGTTRRSLSTC
jgi:hypothetical protein